MKKYFKHYAESDLGVGEAYLEFRGQWASRQVEVYPQKWRRADQENNTWLADQPLDAIGLESEHEITAEEFESIWEEALERCP